MKKTLITALLIIFLSSTGLFAAVSDNFNVTTVVANVDLMTISTTQFTGTTVAAFEALVPFTTLAISGGGAQTFNAWLSTLSNNRAGFNVTMKATAMKSSIAGQADAFINYTVTCNLKSVTTNDAAEVTAASPILTYASLNAVTKTSNKISLTVVQTDFDKALSGSYTGTVTFIYTAN